MWKEEKKMDIDRRTSGPKVMRPRMTRGLPDPVWKRDMMERV
jgi:hypothetical protein